MTKLRQLRMQQGVRAAEFFKPAKLWPADFYRLERGEVKASVSVRTAVANCLKVDQGQIFDKDGWPLACLGELAPDD